MVQFHMVKYHKQTYPPNIPLHLEEVAGHFDIKKVCPDSSYSLHTEYSYGSRLFKNALLQKYPEIIQANKNGVPMLWKNKTWAEKFAEFLIELTKPVHAPKVIEIHPPFNDYMESIEEFIETYKVFEEIIKNTFTQTNIQIENRCGSKYYGGQFLISTVFQIKELCQHIASENLSLRIALDIPQLYTAHQVTPKKCDGITELLHALKEVRQYIGGVHIWGKTLSNGRRIAHCGNLDTYFNNKALKQAFLDALHQLFNDNQTRNLVLEVNSSNKDLLSIMQDLDSAGFTYL